MFWDQQMGYEPQDRRSNERKCEAFVRMADARVVRRGQRPDRQEMVDFHIISGPMRAEKMISTVDTYTLEIDAYRMEEIINAVEELDDAQRKFRAAQQALEEINEENNEFHTFMAGHPELREQYRELMTMCKLAGLRKIPSKLT